MIVLNEQNIELIVVPFWIKHAIAGHAASSFAANLGKLITKRVFPHELS
jgi:hypothetical protein